MAVYTSEIPQPGFLEQASGAAALTGIILAAGWFLINLPDLEVIPILAAPEELPFVGLVLGAGEVWWHERSQRLKHPKEAHPLYPIIGELQSRRRSRRANN